MTATYKLGPWPLGIDNVSKPNSLKRDQNGRVVALRDAFNVDIDRDGLVQRRRGFALATALPGLHSLWTGVGGTYGVAAGTLYRFDGELATAVCALNSDDPMSFDDFNDEVIASNRTTILRVRGTQWRTLGVPNAPMPAVAADPAGGMRAGRYSVAIAYLRGTEEGALSPLQSVTVSDGGGIRLAFPAPDPEATAIRIYRTEIGGEVLYRCIDAPVGLPNYLIGSDQLGKDSPTMYLTRMLPGDYVQLWRGLLLVARGRTIYWSEPMSYGLTSLRHNFVQLPRRIHMMIGMEGGVFIGTDDGVIWLDGAKPGDWNIKTTSGKPPIRRCWAKLSGDDTDLQQVGRQLCVWMSETGFVVGTEDGNIIPVQANRLRIPLASSGSLAVNARRATAVLL